MLDGIRWTIESGTPPEALLAEISKKPGDPGSYLEQDRAYRAEVNVFETFTQKERDRLFGVPPATVWENMQNLIAFPERVRVLTAGNALTPRVINAFCTAATARWKHELLVRIIPEDLDVVRACQPLDLASDRAQDLWKRIDALRHELADDTAGNPALCTRLMSALSSDSLQEASRLQLVLADRMDHLRQLEDEYHKLVF
jgi:glutamine synthetase